MTTALTFYDASQMAQAEQELLDLLRIPSVSTDPAFAPQCQQAAEWVSNHLRHIGLASEVIQTARHPLVYAEWLGAGATAKTVLIYGHYDVQPAVKEDGWDTEPFEPVIRDGRVYARGATDDKGQFFTHIKAVESLLKAEGKLPVNVKFIIEGEEESGGENLAKFVREHGDRLKADVCVISDSSMATIDTPVIVYSVRGVSGMEVSISGPSTDLHSGMYGGTVHNPIQALVEIFAQLHHADGRVAVDGFYDDVLPISDADREAIAKGQWDLAEWSHETGAPTPWGEAQYTLSERIGARPTLELTGIGGGYHGAGVKAVIPAKATGKILCRLVANQDPIKIYELVKAHIEKLVPPTIKLDMRYIAGGFPATLDITHPTMHAAEKAYAQGWGATPIFKREGGAIPIIADFKSRLNMPVIMMGFGLNTDGLHGPNEHYALEMFHRGVRTSIHFLHEVAGL
jgi:acetylornithine deacetylase/succinyl-diaminopimelate desuccinylase-like protein